MAEKFILSVTPKNSMEPRTDMKYVGQFLHAITVKDKTGTKTETVQIIEIQLILGNTSLDGEKVTGDYYLGISDTGRELFKFWADSVNVAYGYRETIEDPDAPFSDEVCDKIMRSLPIEMVDYRNPVEYSSTTHLTGWNEDLIKYLVEEGKLQYVEVRVECRGGALSPPFRTAKQFIKRELYHQSDRNKENNQKWLESIKNKKENETK